MLKGIIPFAHQLLQETIEENDIVLDATCGNGNDTLFLSTCVGKNGHVYAFDIQKQAIEKTKEKLQDTQMDNVTYVLGSHHKLDQYIEEKHINNIKAAIFNLGYLPGSDKTITTTANTTIQAVDLLLQYMPKGGLIILVVYHGHDQGKKEKNDLLPYLYYLDQKKYAVLQYGFVNQINDPPFILAIQKR